MPDKVLWMRRIRVLRRMLKKYRASEKIDAHLYHELYMKVKGNVFKNKKNLMEYIHKAKNELKREKVIEDQAAIRRDRNKKRRAAASKTTRAIFVAQASAAAQPEPQKQSG
jgi:large subunit ribosomal protein L19e